MFRIKRAPKDDDTVTIRRMFTDTNLQISTTWAGASYAFSFNNLPFYGQLQNVFEMYRVNWIKIHFKPEFNSLEGNQLSANVAAATTGGLTVPRMYSVIDEDGEINTSSESYMQSYNTVTLHRNPLLGFTVFIRNPCAQSVVANSLTLTGAAPTPGIWIDTANASVAYYGAGVGGIMPFSTGSSANTMTFTPVYEVSVSLRGVKAA